jgi:hypothetical protein
MIKKCKKCKVPLEGFLYRLIAKTLFGVLPSTKDPELCNKCEDMPCFDHIGLSAVDTVKNLRT